MDIKRLAQAYLDETVATRRELHRHPELSGQEARTARMVRNGLDRLGVPYRDIPDHGVLGVIDSGRPGRAVALRADMDALAVAEQISQPYRSTVDGVSHVCGHDCHTASLLTAARILIETKADWRGRVNLIFQPSEEGPPGGAHVMIAGGAMDGIDAIFAVHMTNMLDAGQVSVEPGPRMAASLRAYIDIVGRGGHGGAPHECIDAVLAGSAVVINLQSIASREMKASDPAIITVGLFRGGTVFNAVAEDAHLEATVKFFNLQLADHLRDSITRIAERTAETFGAGSTVRVEGLCPPVINDPALSKIATDASSRLFGPESVRFCPAWGASEDFSRYLARSPGVFAFIGGRNESKGCVYPNHHPRFDIDEQALAVASALYAQFAVDFLVR